MSHVCWVDLSVWDLWTCCASNYVTRVALVYTACDSKTPFIHCLLVQYQDPAETTPHGDLWVTLGFTQKCVIGRLYDVPNSAFWVRRTIFVFTEQALPTPIYPSTHRTCILGLRSICVVAKHVYWASIYLEYPHGCRSSLVIYSSFYTQTPYCTAIPTLCLVYLSVDYLITTLRIHQQTHQATKHRHTHLFSCSRKLQPALPWHARWNHPHCGVAARGFGGPPSPATPSPAQSSIPSVNGRLLFSMYIYIHAYICIDIDMYIYIHIY